MASLTKYIRIGNTKKERLDFLVYIPHISEDKNFLKIIRETSKVPLSHISDDILYRYLRHETDTGMREIAYMFEKILQNSEFAFGILSVEIPRGFCDLNRPLERAISPILHTEKWEKMYKQAEEEVEKILQMSDFVFHLHSMNNFDSIEPSVLGNDISEEKILYHLEKVYTGRKRECTILTENTEGNYVTNKVFDDILKKNFQKYNVALEENTAYRFVEDYPCTNIARKIPSAFLEITKGALATPQFANIVDTSYIEFDDKKVEFFAKILAESFENFLLKK